MRLHPRLGTAVSAKLLPTVMLKPTRGIETCKFDQDRQKHNSPPPETFPSSRVMFKNAPDMLDQLQLWTALPRPAEWTRRGHPAHPPLQRPPGAERTGRHKGRTRKGVHAFMRAHACTLACVHVSSDEAFIRPNTSDPTHNICCMAV
eukprot:354767-Chlamydomonas_euryale.AAC.6